MWHDRCAWVRARLPLQAGDELVDLDRRLVERHLIGCADCRDRLEALRGTLGVLQAAAERSSAAAETPSLWPALARQIRESNRPATPAQTWDRVASWAPAWPRLAAWSAVAAVVLGLLVGAHETRPTPRLTPTSASAFSRLDESIRLDPELALSPIVPAGERIAQAPTLPKSTRSWRSSRAPGSVSIRVEPGRPGAAPKTEVPSSVEAAPASRLEFEIDRGGSPAESHVETQFAY